MILVLIEQSGGEISKTAAITIGAALKAKEAHGYAGVTGVIIGQDGVQAAAEKAARFGLAEVVTVSSVACANYLALPFAQVLVQVIDALKPKLVLAAATSMGKDLLPRLAAKYNAGQASDVVQFLPERGYQRLMYAGNIVADIELSGDLHFATVRTTAFDVPTFAAAPSPVRALAIEVASDPRQQFVSFETVKSERPELTSADIVVSGGRAMKSAENFETYIAPLADALGAAIGASRAAVDSGYAPNDWQVGQTGKVVAPALYIAVGISGAIQHLAGMKDSKTIVAINKDPEAPIFEIADYGLVADLYQAIPELTAAVKRVKG